MCFLCVFIVHFTTCEANVDRVLCLCGSVARSFEVMLKIIMLIVKNGTYKFK